MKRIGNEITLEQIDDFFTIGKKVENVRSVPRSCTRPQKAKNLIHCNPDLNEVRHQEPEYKPTYQRYGAHDDQKAYVTKYRQQEKEKLIRRSEQPPGAAWNPSDLRSEISSLSGLERLETDTVMTGATTVLPEGQTEAQAVAIYNNYNFNYEYDPKLSITKYAEEIMNTIECNHVTVIEGPTGCGKTTQVPQYILDYHRAQNKYCNIVVTQPRRIAAVGVAKRVCMTRDWSVGGICGYQVGMDRDNRSEDTRLLYCTTGVLKNRLIRAQHMNDYTHIILDEVHERELETDFLLLVVRKFLHTTSPNVKVVVMSATINAELFAAYFAQPLGEHLEPAPIFKIEEERQFVVKDYYLEDLVPLCKDSQIPEIRVENPCIEEDVLDLAKNLILWFDRIEEQEQGLDPTTGFARIRGSVLVFLPGLFDINKLESQLDTPEVQHRHRLLVIPLHSTITAGEQLRVFEPAQNGCRKVILSTNIAESSITVKDIKYVIDFCLTKEMVTDPGTTFCRLQPTWASRASLEQRRGRAGRVSAGRCYRMITREFMCDCLPTHNAPEMERCPLEHVVLNAKMLDMGEPKALLSLAINAPDESKIEYAILVLKQVGALAASGANPFDGDLTFMGRLLAELPVDIRVGKLMLLGHAFGMLEECIIIAAALNCQSFFARPFKVQFEAYKKKLEWSDRSQSDCIALLKAYQVWAEKKRMGVFKRGGHSEKAWGHQNFIDIPRVNQVHLLVEDLAKRLESFNIRKPPPVPAHRVQESREEEDELILKIIFCGAFYPNYFYKNPGTDEKEGTRIMAGKNHFNTVLVRGLPANQGNIYGEELRRMFQPCHSDPKIEFEETRAYIEFPRDHTTLNQYHQAVYLALKMKQINKKLSLSEGDPEMVRHKVQELSFFQKSKANTLHTLRSNRIMASTSNGSTHPGQVEPPSPDETSRAVDVTEVVDCGRFWCNYSNEETWLKVGDLQNDIKRHAKSTGLKALPEPQQRIGVYCLALFEEEYYRARIEKVEHTVRRDGSGVDVKTTVMTVFYLDYGNQAELTPSEVKVIPAHLLQTPFQAFECELCEITPAARMCPNGRWTRQAKACFQDFIQPSRGGTFYIQVFSVVYGVVRVKLFLQTDSVAQNINVLLVRRGFADTCAESHLSVVDNKKRQARALLVTGEGVGRTVLGGGSSQSMHITEWVLKSEEEKQRSTSGAAQKGGRRINLLGPISPFEMSWRGITKGSRLRKVRVERDSVNCICMDEDPGALHERLLSAASVVQSQTGEEIRLQNTTVLPNIRGLAPLIPILFAPSVEMRCDRRFRRYTGYLCGLGYDAWAGGSALPDHDMEVAFDTEFTVDHLLDVNEVRMAMNVTTDTTADPHRQGSHVQRQKPMISWAPQVVLKFQQKARDKLLRLLSQRRKTIESPSYPAKQYKWNLLPEQCMMRPCVPELDQQPALLPLISGIHLNDDDTESVTSDSGSSVVGGAGGVGGRHRMGGSHRMGGAHNNKGVGGANGARRMGGTVTNDARGQGGASAGVGGARTTVGGARAAVGGGTDEREMQRRHIEWLKTQVNSTTPERITCHLCAATVNTPRELRVHLATIYHKQQEATLL